MKPNFIALVFLCITLSGCGMKERQPELFLVPDGYVGWLHVEYEMSDAPELLERNGYRILKFSRSGIIQTSSPFLEGMAKDKTYYTTAQGWKELTVSDDGGDGMLWADHTSGPNYMVFVGTWRQYSGNKSSSPQSKER